MEYSDDCPTLRIIRPNNVAENDEIQIKASAKALYAFIGLLLGGATAGGLFHFGVADDFRHSQANYVTHEELEKILRTRDRDLYMEKLDCEKKRNEINQRLHNVERDAGECIEHVRKSK